MSELLTVAQVAAVLQCSEDSVIRRFASVKGVIDLGTAETRAKRRYRVLRIPKSVVEAHLVKLGGASVKVEVQDKPPRRRMSNRAWMDRAVLQLADIGKRNDCTDRKTFATIASRARLLAASVDEKYWSEICSGGWLDEDTDED
jgi:hypothetical protein